MVKEGKFHVARVVIASMFTDESKVKGVQKGIYNYQPWLEKAEQMSPIGDMDKNFHKFPRISTLGSFHNLEKVGNFGKTWKFFQAKVGKIFKAFSVNGKPKSQTIRN